MSPETKNALHRELVEITQRYEAGREEVQGRRLVLEGLEKEVNQMLTEIVSIRTLLKLTT